MSKENKPFVVVVECMFRKEVEVNAISAEDAESKVKSDHAHGDNIPEFDNEVDIWDSLQVMRAMPKENEIV